MKDITLNSILQEISAEAEGSFGKTASVGGSDAVSPLLNLTEDELMKLADSIEGEGHVNAAAERIVQMKKEASVKEGQGPSALDIYIEMRKVAYQRAREELGLAPKTAGDASAPVLRMLLGGERPLHKLAEVAAYYYLGRLTNTPANDGSGR